MDERCCQRCDFRSWYVTTLLAWGMVGLGVRGVGGEVPALEGRRRPDLVLIQPGTVVGLRPPSPWSHLVIKSLPVLASGDLEAVPESAFRMAAMIRTVILADVVRVDGTLARYELARVGVGLCMPEGPEGADVVVASNRPEPLIRSLGIVEKVVLETAETELRKGRLVAGSPTFAVFRAPTVMLAREEHHRVELYYALLVDPGTGSLRVLVWPRDLDGAPGRPPRRLVELSPNLVYRCPLDVKAIRLLGTVPVSWSFGMRSLPPGTIWTVPPDLAHSLAALVGGETSGLEQALRRALSGSQGPNPPNVGPSPAGASSSESGLGPPARTST